MCSRIFYLVCSCFDVVCATKIGVVFKLVIDIVSILSQNASRRVLYSIRSIWSFGHKTHTIKNINHHILNT